MSSFTSRKFQVGIDPAAAKNFTLEALGVNSSNQQSIFGINVGDVDSGIISSPIKFTMSDVSLLNAKSQEPIQLGDNSQAYATTSWAINKFGSNDVYATWTTNGNIALVGVDIQPNGEWNRVLAFTEIVLVKDQTDATKNGWYFPREGAWVRIDTKDASNKITNSVLTRVSEGSNYADTLWLLATNITSSFVLGTSPLTFLSATDSRGAGKPLDIIKISNQGYNSILFLTKDGALYEAHGSASSYNQHNSGRGAVNTALVWGIPNATPIVFPSNSPVVDFVLLFSSSYALLANGELYSWGVNTNGELGLGHNTNTNRPILSTTNVSKLFDNTCLGIANASTMFIQKTDGWVYATGHNAYGVMGLGDTLSRNVWTRLEHIGQNPLSVWITGGYSFIFYQKPDLTVWACGYNGYGQLGDGSTVQRNSPVNVSNSWLLNVNMRIKKVVAGNGWIVIGNSSNSLTSVMMLLDDGTTTDIRTCGNNNYGQLGDGTLTQRVAPIRPNVGSGRVKDISSNCDGVTSFYVLKEDSGLYVIGYNAYGQLGTGNTSNVTIPYRVLDGVRALLPSIWKYSHGHYQCGYIIRDDGLYSTGYNGNGEGGWGDDNGNKSVWTRCSLPIAVNANKIKCFGGFTTTPNGLILTLVTTDNVGWSWGYNGNYGVLYNYASYINAPTITTIYRGH